MEAQNEGDRGKAQELCTIFCGACGTPQENTPRTTSLCRKCSSSIRAVELTQNISEQNHSGCADNLTCTGPVAKGRIRCQYHLDVRRNRKARSKARRICVEWECNNTLEGTSSRFYCANHAVGKCVECKQPPAIGRMRCRYHLDQRAGKKRKSQLRRMEQEAAEQVDARCISPYCKDPPAIGRRRCQYHLDRGAEQRIKLQLRRMEQEAAGEVGVRCTSPGCKDPPAIGRMRCQYHIDQRAGYWRWSQLRRMEQEAAGEVDVRCTSAHCTDPPDIGRRKCRYHLDLNNAKNKRFRQRKKEATTKQAEIHTGVDQHDTNTLDVDINTQSNVDVDVAMDDIDADFDIDVDMDDTDADMNNNSTAGNVTLPPCYTIINSLIADSLFTKELNFAITLPPIVDPLMNISTDPKAGH